MEDTPDSKTGRLTRRSALYAALAGGLPHLLNATIPRVKVRPGSDLYVYPGSGPGRVTIATVSTGRSRAESVVRIHDGFRDWTVPLPAAGKKAVEWKQGECRFRASTVPHGSGFTPAFQSIAIVDTPTGFGRATGPMRVWAEHLFRDGFRVRIGSPCVAELLRSDPRLAELYHSLSPEDDVAALTEPVARAIAARARANMQSGTPEAYGRRVAALLLPDVLSYDAAQPCGLTFAARNGLRPEDSWQPVVNSILDGSLSQPLASQSRQRDPGLFAILHAFSRV